MGATLTEAESACLAAIAGHTLAWSRESRLVDLGIEVSTLAALEAAGWVVRWEVGRRVRWTLTPWGAYAWTVVLRETHVLRYVVEPEDPRRPERPVPAGMSVVGPRTPTEDWRLRWCDALDDPIEGRVSSIPPEPDRVAKVARTCSLSGWGEEGADMDLPDKSPSPLEELVMVEEYRERADGQGAEVVARPLTIFHALVKVARGKGWGKRPELPRSA